MSDEELGKRLMGLFREGLEKQANDRVSRDVTQSLMKGGVQGARTFLITAEEILKSPTGGKVGLLRWVESGLPALPKNDQDILIATMLDFVIRQGAVKKILGE